MPSTTPLEERPLRSCLMAHADKATLRAIHHTHHPTTVEAALLSPKRPHLQPLPYSGARDLLGRHFNPTRISSRSQAIFARSEWPSSGRVPDRSDARLCSHALVAPA
jgi:hypothetical protein